MPASIIASNTTTPKKQKIRVVVRNAIEEDWLKVDPKIDSGEIVYTSDKNTLKVGDGQTKYSDLTPIAGGGSGTTDYEDLSNKPSINNVTLSGDKTASDLGLATAAQGGAADTALQPGDNVSSLVNDAGYINSIKTINGNSLVGTGNVELSTYLPYPIAWDTGHTTKDFCDDINADTTAVEGMAYLGEVTFTDMPNNIGNAECVVEIMMQNPSTKTIKLTLSSGNVAPYMWVYTYWNNGTNVSGWQTWATSAQGSKADTAVQSVTTGSTNGTISVDGTDVSVYGLGSAAYTSSSDYATSAQGSLADTALQPGDLSNYVTTNTTQTISGEKTFSGKLNYCAGMTYILAGNGGTKLGYWSYDIDGQSNITLQTMTASTRNINFKTNNGGKVTYNGSEIAKKSDIPTNVSSFTNDSGYITGINSSDVTTALGYTPVDPSSLATVATTGAYSDLSGTPTIPTVNNPTITITQGGVTKGSFTLNQSSGDTIALDAGGGSSLPSQTGHAGEFLKTDGTDPSWDIATAVTFRIW